MTWARITDVKNVHVVERAEIAHSIWLRPGTPSAGQQAFGNDLLNANIFVLLPSVVSTHSWVVIFDPGKAAGLYDRIAQESFALDSRLRPPVGTAP